MEENTTEREKVLIDLNGFKEEDVLDLKDWLENSGVSGLTVTETHSDPKEGVMGVEWIPVLTALLSTPVIVELVKTVRDWIRYRRKKIRVVIVKADGTRIEVDSENIKPANLL